MLQSFIQGNMQYNFIVTSCPPLAANINIHSGKVVIRCVALHQAKAQYERVHQPSFASNILN